MYKTFCIILYIFIKKKWSAESFYNFRYGSLIVTSNVSQKISVVFLLSSRQNMIQKQTIFLETPVFFFVFITENFWWDFWHNNGKLKLAAEPLQNFCWILFSIITRLCYFLNWLSTWVKFHAKTVLVFLDKIVILFRGKKDVISTYEMSNKTVSLAYLQ